MSSQKDAVVAAVILAIPTFRVGTDIASSLLTEEQLNSIKADIMNGIINGNIDYSKDKCDHAEVRTYARSMVANHLKKAKELNGGKSYVPATTRGATASHAAEEPSLKDVDVDILSDELKEYIKQLI